MRQVAGACAAEGTTERNKEGGKEGRLRRDERRRRRGEGAAARRQEGDDEAEQAENTVPRAGAYQPGWSSRVAVRGAHLEKISMTRTLTNSCGSAASAMAALAPEMPTATPHRRLHMPAVSPPQKSE